MPIVGYLTSIYYEKQNTIFFVGDLTAMKVHMKLNYNAYALYFISFVIK